MAPILNYMKLYFDHLLFVTSETRAVNWVDAILVPWSPDSWFNKLTLMSSSVSLSLGTLADFMCIGWANFEALFTDFIAFHLMTARKKFHRRSKLTFHHGAIKKRCQGTFFWGFQWYPPQRPWTRLNLPLHSFPFLLYPGLHVQVYDPYVLLQNASRSHLSEPLVHSSISDNKIANMKFCNDQVK